MAVGAGGQFANDHSQQQAAQAKFAGFAEFVQQTFQALLRETEQTLATQYGSYHTAFMDVHARIDSDRQKATQLVNLMSEKMGQVNTDDMNADDHGSTTMTNAGSAGQASLGFSIFA